MIASEILATDELPVLVGRALSDTTICQEEAARSSVAAGTQRREC